MQVQVGKARVAQAEGPYPGNLQAAAYHLQQAVLVCFKMLLLVHVLAV